MNKDSIKKKIENLGKKGSVFGLETVRSLAEAAGNPQASLKFVHIAGTNGKGSVLAYISTVLTASGFKTGRYISPSVTSYFEKLQINGREITEEKYLSLAEYLLRLSEEKNISPTLFELETVLGFLWFKEEGCDIVVLETGLGGELDATNIVKTTVLSVITSIGLDHKDVLGKSLGEIASAKAGIIKERVPVCTGEQGESLSVIRKRAAEKNSPLYIADSGRALVKTRSIKGTVFNFEGHKDIEIRLLGSFQVKNAVLALKAIDALNNNGFNISEEKIAEGMKKTKWHGRMEIICEKPLFICDGAHNPQGAKALRESMEGLFGGKKLIIILGILKDKDYMGILEEILPMARKVFAVTPKNKRGLKGEILRKIIEEKGISCEETDTEKAGELACREAREGDIILACGSLSYLGDVIKYGKSKQNII